MNINSPNKNLLSTDFVPGTVLYKEDTKVDVIDRALTLRRLYSMVGWGEGVSTYI